MKRVGVDTIPGLGWRNGTALLHVKVTPKASRTAVIGILPAVGHEPARLRIAVTEPADGGKANRALITFLARRLKHPKSAFVISAGETDRAKTIAIADAGEDLPERLAALLPRA